MRFELFCKNCSEFWDNYLKTIVHFQTTGALRSTGRVLFPTMIVFTDCGESYAAELFGASEKLMPLIIKKAKNTLINRYLNYFSDKSTEPFLTLKNCSMVLIDTMIMGPSVELNKLNKRLTPSDLILSAFVGPTDCDAALAFCENFRSIILNNFIATNCFENAVRSKFIMNLIAVSRHASPSELNLLLKKLTPKHGEKAFGVHTVGAETEKSFLVAGQLQSLLLLTSIRETTVGEFLSHNMEIVLQAFGARSALYEKSFDWVEHDGTVTDKQINPDLLLETSDGLWTIVDLKTAAMDKPTITKGERKRRRFIDYVNEGFAQLANYRFYFAFEKNREFARRKFGVENVSSSCILVVGNEENANQEEIREASRSIKDITVIDYDTLISMFLLATPQWHRPR